MDQKDKDCAYWIGVLLAGLALGIVGGFVFGWLWKEGPTSSEATKLVDVFIAVGTVGSAMIALLFGLGQKIKEEKTKRIRKEIALGELRARLRTAFLNARLLKGAYLMIGPKHATKDVVQVLPRVEAHLQNLIDLFDDAFLESFGEAWEEGAIQLVTQLSVIKLLRVEFGLFVFDCHANINRAERRANENRQRVDEFSKMLSHLESSFEHD